MTQHITVGEGGAARRVAVAVREGREPAVVWFGGFRSDMSGTKAETLDVWAADRGNAYVRFDYSGHGRSGGRFEDGTIGRWLEDGLAVLAAFAPQPPVLVGSSMGGWIAVLAALRLRRTAPARAPCGLVLLAPAVDFTERLMWDAFPDEVRTALWRDGVWHRPSAYSDEPYPITRRLIEEGRHHLIGDSHVETGCPVHIIQGMKDEDVPWQHGIRLAEHLPGDSVQITVVPDGDHRLSRPADLDRLVAAVAAATKRCDPAVS